MMITIRNFKSFNDMTAGEREEILKKTIKFNKWSITLSAYQSSVKKAKQKLGKCLRLIDKDIQESKDYLNINLDSLGNIRTDVNVKSYELDTPILITGIVNTLLISFGIAMGYCALIIGTILVYLALAFLAATASTTSGQNDTLTILSRNLYVKDLQGVTLTAEQYNNIADGLLTKYVKIRDEKIAKMFEHSSEAYNQYMNTYLTDK